MEYTTCITFTITITRRATKQQYTQTNEDNISH